MLPCTVLSSSFTVSACSAVDVKRARHLVFAHTFEEPEHFYATSVAASDCVRASSSKAKIPVAGMLQCLVRFASFVERQTCPGMGCQARRSHCAPAFWFRWWYELVLRARNLSRSLDANPSIPLLCSIQFSSFFSTSSHSSHVLSLLLRFRHCHSKSRHQDVANRNLSNPIFSLVPWGAHTAVARRVAIA